MLRLRAMRAHLSATWIALTLGCSNPSEQERGSIEVLIGSGNGTFAPGWEGTAHLPRALAMADLDGDERAELAVARYDSAVVTYAETAAGEFEARMEYQVARWPNSILTLDVNADGAQDVIVACAGKINVLLGEGDGELSAPMEFPGGENTALAALDFNHDSVSDIAIASLNSVVLLRGSRDGRFEPSEALTLASPIHDIVTADVNGDGNTDILATAVTRGLLAPEHGTVYVLLAEPAGFAPPVLYESPNGGQKLTLADANGDSQPDLIVTGRESVGISLGTTEGTFAPFAEHLVGSGARSALVQDFNSDSIPDLAVAHTKGYVTISIGSATGFGAAVPYAAGIVPWSLIATDINRDDQFDLLVVNEGGQGLP